MNLNKRNKKIIMCLSVLLTLSQAGYMQAQSYTTSNRHYYFYDDESDSTIVRNWDDTVVFTCSHHPNNTLYSHIFHMRKSTVLPAKEVGMPILMGSYGRIVDRINDMRILENECYFCGTRISPIGAEFEYDTSGNIHIEYTYDTCGFIGYYSFDNLLNVVGIIQVYLISNVKSVLRMAVYNSEYNNNVTCIELVGIKDTDTQPKCLVEMSRTGTGPDVWSYVVITPSLSDEIFTDVVLTDEILVTASVYGNNDGEIGFRHIKPTQYPFSQPLSPTTDNDLYKYDTRNYSSTHFIFGFTRLSNAPVRLCARQNGFIAGVAGKPVTGSGPIEIGNYVFVFDMAWPNMMREFQSANTGWKLSCKEMTYLEQKKAVGILYSSTYSSNINYMRTFLQFPRLGAVSVGGQYTDTLMYYGDGDLHSIDTYKGHSVSLGGIRQAGAFPSDGIQRQYNRSNSCYALYGEGVIYRDPVLTPRYFFSGWTHSNPVGAERVEYQPIKDFEGMTMSCSH